MKKTFCDICGKEIGDFEGHHEVEIDTLLTSTYTHTYELCESCVAEISETLKGKSRDKNVL